MYPAIDPADVEALTACIDYVVEHLYRRSEVREASRPSLEPPVPPWLLLHMSSGRWCWGRW